MPITVSFVEDHAPTRKAIAGVIRSDARFRFLAAHATADEAVTALAARAPDVVLVDIELAEGQSGIDCVRRFKELRPELRVLMFTVYEDSDRLFRALAAGADGYVLKRDPPERLLEAIADVMAGGAPMSRSVARKVLQHFHDVEATKAAPELESLTEREREILSELTTGYSDKEIAKEMGITFDTVRAHLKSIYRKLHVRGRMAAVNKLLGREGR